MRVLIVEDYSPLRSSLSIGLREEGYAVDAAADGDEGWWYAKDETYDIMILDVMLPGLNGVELVKRIRGNECKTPIILLSAKDAVEDRIAGLDAGADDYLCKPFSAPELLARLRSLIRRSSDRIRSDIEVGDLCVDTVTKSVKRGERAIELTLREYQLLMLLAKNPGAPVSREDLEKGLIGFNEDVSENFVPSLVARLRNKLQVDGETPLIHSQRGHGYHLSADS